MSLVKEPGEEAGEQIRSWRWRPGVGPCPREEGLGLARGQEVCVPGRVTGLLVGYAFAP